jgi:putative lipoic acid-binding regulatory protein
MPEAAGDGERQLLRFPCDFPVKVMGRAVPGFEALVVEIVRRHAPDLGEGAVSSRGSSGGRYLALTLTVRAESRAQLDAIYRELSAHPDVLMSL